MPHALIMEDNIIVGQAVARQLTQIGFRSFTHAWTEHQAMEAARNTQPTLIVIGDRVEQGSAIAAARAISRTSDAPIIVATTDGAAPDSPLPTDMNIHGPFRLDQISDMVQERFPAMVNAEMIAG